MDKMVKISHFLSLCLELSSLLPQIIPKISSLGQKSNLQKYIGPFFLQKMTKNGKF